MVTAPLQLSNEPTFVSLDFSVFSEKDNVAIGEKTIDNFKALKVFAEEQKSIYRWEFGESHIDHKHRGIIVKAASFITPDFHPSNQKISTDFSPLEQVSKETLKNFREYLAKAKTVDSGLLQEERIKIEEVLKVEAQKENMSQKLGKIMQLTKLIARSYGRKDMLLEDFERARWLIDQQVIPKPVK